MCLPRLSVERSALTKSHYCPRLKVHMTWAFLTGDPACVCARRILCRIASGQGARRTIVGGAAEPERCQCAGLGRSVA